jgi:hypothetical protein
MTAVMNGDSRTADMARLEQDLASVRTELANFRTLVRNVAINRAIEHEWCSVIDDILDELGLEPRRRAYDVEVKVTYTAWVQVSAASETDALEQIESESRTTQLRVFSPFEDVPLTEVFVNQRDVTIEVSSAEVADD